MRTLAPSSRSSAFDDAFAIVETLGRQGQMYMYRGRGWNAEGTRQEVMLRGVAGGHPQHPWLRERLLVEGQLLAQLDSEFVVRFHRVIDRAAGTYIVQDMVRGRRLSELLPDPDLGLAIDDELAVFIALGILRALAHLESVGRSLGPEYMTEALSPASVVLTADGRVLLDPSWIVHRWVSIRLTGEAPRESEGNPVRNDLIRVAYLLERMIGFDGMNDELRAIHARGLLLDSRGFASAGAMAKALDAYLGARKSATSSRLAAWVGQPLLPVSLALSGAEERFFDPLDVAPTRTLPVANTRILPQVKSSVLGKRWWRRGKIMGAMVVGYAVGWMMLGVLRSEEPERFQALVALLGG